MTEVEIPIKMAVPHHFDFKADLEHTSEEINNAFNWLKEKAKEKQLDLSKLRFEVYLVETEDLK